MISPETIDRVRQACDIVEILGEYLPSIKRAGKDYKALCPFHQEKTPSFMISPAKGIFHCFGCGMGGDVFKFVMEMDRLTYPQAIQKLADRSGIAVEQDAHAHQGLQQDRKKFLLQLMQRAAEFYHKSLYGAQGQVALKYLQQKRALSSQTLQQFKVGWAQGPQSLLKVALSSGYTEQDLIQAGLAVKGRNGKVYDCFRQRIVFPICDTKGQIVAFGGRILETDVAVKTDFVAPKYLNSPETLLFQKGQTLYGFYQAAQALRQQKSALILEGYMDVIGCQQAGFLNCAAPLGTALTLDQCRLLKRYVDDVVLLFDADRAGDNAAWRGAELLLQFGFIPRVARLPDGLDADEYLQQHTLDQFQDLLKNSVHFLEFCFNAAWEKSAHLPLAARKHQIAQTLMPLVLKIESDVLRAEMLKFLSDRLALPQEVLLSEFAKIVKKDLKRQHNLEQRQQVVNKTKSVSRFLSLEEDLIASIVQNFGQLDVLDAQEQQDVFAGVFAQECLAALLSGRTTLAGVQSALSPGGLEWLSSLLARQLVNEKPQEVFASLLQRLRFKRQEKQLQVLLSKERSGSLSTEEVRQLRLIRSFVKGRGAA